MSDFTYPELRMLEEIEPKRKTIKQLKRYSEWLQQSEGRHLRMAQEKRKKYEEHEQELKRRKLKVVPKFEQMEKT